MICASQSPTNQGAVGAFRIGPTSLPNRPRVNGRASKETRLNPAKIWFVRFGLSALQGTFLTSPQFIRGWGEAGVEPIPDAPRFRYQSLII